MSFNQSRSDKSEQQYRKSGRSASFNQQRTSSGAYGRGAGGVPAPSPALSSSSNQSFKKYNNAQGGQSRVTSPAVNSINTPAVHNVQNGALVQPQLQGASNEAISGSTAKPVELATPQRSTRAIPKAPTSQPATMNSDSSSLKTPTKSSGDASKAFSLQFGSISPGFMNGMQIPARTSSAPPNLDEQKRDQARHDSSFRPVPDVPTPVPKHQQPRKDSPNVQSNSGEAHPVHKVKKDSQASVASSTNQTQKSSILSLPINPMQMPFHHQPQVSMQFGGPSPQIQSSTSMQMPMHIPLSMGNAPQVQQQVFVPGLQAHPLTPQGMMHQGQGLSFSPPIGSQIPPHLGSLGMGIAPQYPPQQGGKYGVPRKTTPVKITHPDTHEELRLDKRTDTHSDGGPSGPRSHTNVPSQSQPIPSFAPSHSINYYPNSIFYPPQSSIPFSSSQIAPNAQGPRFNYPVGQGHQNISFMNSAAAHGSVPGNTSANIAHGTSESPNMEPANDAHIVSFSAPSGSVQVTVKPATVSVGEKVVDSPLSGSFPAVQKVGSLKPSIPASEISSTQTQRDLDACQGSSVQQPKPGTESLTSKSYSAAAEYSGVVPAIDLDESQPPDSVSTAPAATSEESMPVIASNASRKESLSRSNSIKDYQKKTGKKGPIQPENQSMSTSILASHTAEHGISSSGAISEAIEAKTTLTSSAADVLSQHTRELPTVNDASLPSLELKTESKSEGLTSVSSDVSGTESNVDSMDTVLCAKIDDSSKLDEQVKDGITAFNGEEGKTSLEEHSTDGASPEIPSKPVPLNSKELKSNKGSASKAIATSNVPTSENERVTNGMDVSPSRIADTTGVEGSHDDNTIASDASLSAASRNEITVTKSVAPDQQFNPVPALDLAESTSKYEREGVQVPGLKDKPVPELSRTKSNTTRGRKKRKEILLKADAAGTTSDLYMAYKGPEEKKETVEIAESNSVGQNLKQISHETPHLDAIESEKIAQNKTEPDDWEDAADISTSKLGTPDDGEKAHGELVNHEKGGSGNIAKKYSRDFLLKFAEKFTDLPHGFEIASDIVETLMFTNTTANANASHFDRDSYSSPGRTMDRQFSGSRHDSRASGMVDDDRWIRQPGSFGPGRDLHLDLGYGVPAGFWPGQGGNIGVLRHPRGQAPLAYVGGILGGPMQPMGPQGGMARNSPDSDRWQRAANYRSKGLIPSPQTPLQMMHKTEKKYEVGKVSGEEESKQRQLKSILNKLTPQNFDKLFEQVKEVNIDNADTLKGVISQIFDKALMEPTFCEMYANFCSHLAGELPDFVENNEKITFKRLLLNKCQEEFERGEREQEEANKVEEEGEAKQTEEEREEKRIKARRRMLGNIRFIGELYKKKMLTERIMHECIKKLLGEYENPDEEDVEALCKLMSTIGEIIDHPTAKVHMDAYFERMAKLSNNMKLSSRVRFMLKDAIDLRKNKWQQRRKVEGPKKIEEVHRDAAQERQAQASRLARGPGINASTRRAPMDFGPRGSMLSSTGSQMGSFRGVPNQARGFGAQDARMDDRQSFEARMSVPLTQRSIGDDSITLGPQGGLARGMSFRGPSGISSNYTTDASPASGDTRRVATGMNGFNSLSERTTYGSREDLMPRYGTDRSSMPAAYDHLSSQERGMNFGNRGPDLSFDRSPASSAARSQRSSFTQNVPPEKGLSEERLHNMSVAAIKEFYSARDEKEVALCIKDLNSPSFHPSMVALFVTDSFERKDVERDLLAKLLVNLTRSHDGVLSHVQLVKGFESVLSTLEDAVNDAPKAAEFLGRIFAKLIIEKVVSLGEIGHLLYDGGEEPGRLREIGLAGDVLGSTLGVIKTEKGESVLNEIRASSSLRVEDFRPPDPYKSRLLETLL